MTDPQVALLQLGMLLVLILLGFPICFTLIAMGVGFGFYAYYTPGQEWFTNRIFDLLVNQTYSVMTSDVLTAVPLFLFMGYIVERANIVDRLFYSIYIAAREIPASLAVAAMITCALFATAVGIIGAVVTLMGLLAFPALLRAGYDTKFSAGVICAGGCLGILIPPSIMLIVYAATAGVSIVQAYAAAMIPGFMLAGLYIIYVVGRAMLNPRLAPKPPERSKVPMHALIWQLITSFLPLAVLIMAVLGAILGGWATPSEAASLGAFFAIVLGGAYRMAALREEGKVQELPSWVGKYGDPEGDWWTAFGAGALLIGGVYVLPYFTLRMFDETFTSIATVLPADPWLVGGPGWSVALALLAGMAIKLGMGRVDLLTRLYPTIPASRSLLHNAGIGALGGLVIGTLYVIIGKALEAAGVFGGLVLPGTRIVITYFGFDIGFWVGFLLTLAYRTVHWETLRDSVYLTARTSAMVCWLFVGSWTFSSVFSYLGGHEVIADFVLGLDLSFGGHVNPAVTFLIIAQIIIFLLGWPLEWSEIIIIFVPIFLPLLGPFHIDPLFFGILVALNLQTSFMTPPMAMAAYYLKGVAPPQVQLIEIFRGCMPFLTVVIISMVLLYNFQWLALWLPRVIYGG
jgi:TRAP-type mannitol/chloroaromatic compound transport system permease large subunit